MDHGRFHEREGYIEVSCGICHKNRYSSIGPHDTGRPHHRCRAEAGALEHGRRAATQDLLEEEML
jgi:hypothetical protein